MGTTVTHALGPQFIFRAALYIHPCSSPTLWTKCSCWG